VSKGQRKQRQRRRVRDERHHGDRPPDRPPLRAEELDSAMQRVADVHVRGRHGASVLEEKAQVRAEGGQDRTKKSKP